MLGNDLLALTITLASALLWLRLNNFAAVRGWVSSQVSRKIIHMGTGPIFVLCWSLFSAAPTSRFLAASVPLLITLQFLLVGLGIIKDDSAVKAMARTGDRREILRGPLYYGIIFVVMTLIYWTDSPIGMLALMLMCGGDGLADIIGRRFGRHPLPWAPRKTWEGSLAMLLGGWIFAAGILAFFIGLGTFSGTLTDYLPAVSIIAIGGAAVESLQVHDIDNITITLVSVALGHLLIG